MNAKGQAVLESALLLALIFAVWITLTTGLKKTQFFQNVFGEPWNRLSNTMEFGIPSSSRTTVMAKHPTSKDRHSSIVNTGGP